MSSQTRAPVKAPASSAGLTQGPSLGRAPGRQSTFGNAYVQDMLHEQQSLEQYDAVYARWQDVLANIATEDRVDGDRPAKPVAERVETQLHDELAAAAAAQAEAARCEEGVDPAESMARFDAAVCELERAYFASSLFSTDEAPTGEWCADATRDQLGSRTVDAKLAGWQNDSDLGAVKFAVPTPGPDTRTCVRVGWGASHVEIAGGPVVAAGLLRFDFSGPRPVVSELENVSGGFRPGPLRNATARAAIVAAGYAAATLETHAKEDGTYGGSWMETNPVG